MEKHVVVIGGGIAGASVLHACVSRGFEVTLLEAREDVALEASFANGSLLTPSMSDPWNSPGVGWQLLSSLRRRSAAIKVHGRVVPSIVSWGMQFIRNSSVPRYLAAARANCRLATYSVALTQQLGDQLDIDFNQANCGSLKIFNSKKAMQHFLNLGTLLEPLGVAHVKLDATQAIEREPWLESMREKMCGALFYPNDSVGDARRFAAGLVEDAKRKGAGIRTGVRVTSLRVNSGRFAGLDTTAGFIEAKCAILAAGSKSAGLARTAGVVLPIAPVKGYSLTLVIEHDCRRPNVPVIIDDKHIALVPLGTSLRAVGMAELAGYDKSIDKEQIAALRDHASAVFPEIAASLKNSSVTPWAGLRPVSADGVPYVGETLVEGLWVCSGHGHLGWTQGVGSGTLLADLMTRRPTAIDSSPYRLDR